MSKIIKLTPEYKEECKREFEEMLKVAKVSDGKISFNKTLGIIDRKATVYFTDLAWLKMQSLIREFDKEVAWHGVAKRGDDESKDEYYITDILVYPQEVSGASVEMDVDEYDKWIRDNYEDERFYNIRMQGHSHVRMGVTPSSVDLTHQEAILDQLDDTMFYIFMIWNKSGDKNIKIYDLAKNVLFNTDDITIGILEDGYKIDKFIKDSKEMVRERSYISSFGYGSGATSVNSNFGSVHKDDKGDKKNDSKDDKKNDNSSKGDGKRKGRRKNKKSKNSTYGNFLSSIFEDEVENIYY